MFSAHEMYDGSHVLIACLTSLFKLKRLTLTLINKQNEEIIGNVILYHEMGVLFEF